MMLTSGVILIIAGRVIGLREVRVVNDKVSIARLLVRVISGLQLNISPDSAITDGYVSETTVTRRLTAQYQVKTIVLLFILTIIALSAKADIQQIGNLILMSFGGLNKYLHMQRINQTSVSQ
jgi:hypothetical protein